MRSLSCTVSHLQGCTEPKRCCCRHATTGCSGSCFKFENCARSERLDDRGRRMAIAEPRRAPPVSPAGSHPAPPDECHTTMPPHYFHFVNFKPPFLHKESEIVRECPEAPPTEDLLLQLLPLPPQPQPQPHRRKTPAPKITIHHFACRQCAGTM
jgi:hypothetical protein